MPPNNRDSASFLSPPPATAAEPDVGVPRAARWGLVACIILFFIQAFLLRHYGIDDAAISFRYARHLAEGKGLVWNPGQPPVEGFSNFLWVLILGAGHRIGFDIEILAKLLGVGLGAATLALLQVICRRIWASRPWWWFPVLVVAMCPVWVMWIVSGLELALLGFFLVLAIFALTSCGAAKTWLLSVALCGLAATRPEGIALGGLLLLYALLAHRALTIRRRIREYAVPGLAFTGCIIGLVVFRLAYYGYPFPNTVYAKFSPALPSLTEVGKWVVFVLPFLLAYIPALRRSTNPHCRFVLGASLLLVVAQMLLVLPVSPVMYFLHRYQIPFLPLVALAVPALPDWLRQRRTWLSPIAIVMLSAWTLQPWPGVKASYDGERHYYQQHRCVVEKLARLPGQPLIALLDAGRIPYWSNLPALDAWGLCDSRIAQEGFSTQAVFQGPLGPPDVYIMTTDIFGTSIFPRLGYDKLISSTRFFQDKYKLWQLCVGDRYYGYTILLNIDWAAANGLMEAAGTGSGQVTTPVFRFAQ